MEMLQPGRGLNVNEYLSVCSSCRKHDLCHICIRIIHVESRRSVRLMKPWRFIQQNPRKAEEEQQYSSFSLLHAAFNQKNGIISMALNAKLKLCYLTWLPECPLAHSRKSTSGIKNTNNSSPNKPWELDSGLSSTMPGAWNWSSKIKLSFAFPPRTWIQQQCKNFIWNLLLAEPCVSKRHTFCQQLKTKTKLLTFSSAPTAVTHLSALTLSHNNLVMWS